MSIAIEKKFKAQEEKLDIPQKKKNWFIGMPLAPREESRIPLVPSAVKVLTALGYRVCIESKAGEKAGYTDQDYTENRADIAYAKTELYQADILLQCFPPDEGSVKHMKPGQMLISPLHVGSMSLELLEAMKNKRIIGMAMEYMRDKNGSFPIVRILSELAGTSAILQGAQWMTAQSGGSGVLLGGISGVPPAKVLILGVGIVAEYAIRAAIGLGAQIFVMDNNIYKLMRLQNILGRRLATSSLDPETLSAQLRDADIVIGAIHSAEARTPMVVSEEMVMNMKDGSVIVDVSIDQGGCFETSMPTTLDNPVFEKHGVIHYGVPNISSNYPKTASRAISNILSPIFMRATGTHGVENFISGNKGLAHGIYLYKGSVTNEYLASKFGLNYTALELLMPGDM